MISCLADGNWRRFNMSKELFEVVDREDGTVLSVESIFFDWNKTKARK